MVLGPKEGQQTHLATLTMGLNDIAFMPMNIDKIFETKKKT